jgi:hypothetical protein
MKAFGHREHIELAFLAVHQYGMPRAIDEVCARLRTMTAYHRAPQKYHHTISRAWVEAVAHHVASDPTCTRFDAFAERHPRLLDKRLIFPHYRPTTLAAETARRGWVEPDLHPFPWRVAS